jgi:polyvinyl alcohol dehydrogenase (cytochrome)
MNERLAVAGLAACLVAGSCGSESARTATPPVSTAATVAIDTCDWPMLGREPGRSGVGCDGAITPATVDQLGQAWFFPTDDAVTTAVAVVEGVVYAGDWSGAFYAVDAATGEQRWRRDLEPSADVYAGQIVSSPAVAVAGDRRLVVFGSGPRLHALDAASGASVWTVQLTADAEGPAPEIESSPVVVDGRVIVGFDAHNRSDAGAGVIAVDLATGAEQWRWDGDAGGDPTGCADVWGSPTVDVSTGQVFFGTGNCRDAPATWPATTEAIVAVDLTSGEQRWTFQPHEPNNDDLDFAGAPNLFTVAGRPAVGLGNKDGNYYAVDRASGALLWSAAATEPGLGEPGDNFSTGGFIGASAVAGDIIVGGTGVGPCPCLHGINAETGELEWQQAAPGPTYAPTAIAGGLAFVGGVDFTFRAVEVASGEVRWSVELPAGVASGAAVVDDAVYVGSGFSEPGLGEPSTNAGIYRFDLTTGAAASPTAAVPTATPAAPEVITLTGPERPCEATACDIPFVVKQPPAGLSPTVSLLITREPFSLVLSTRGLGAPRKWLRDGSTAAQDGADRFAVVISERDDEPTGGIVCLLDDGGACTATTVPDPARTYNRISVLALAGDAIPPPSEGLDRMVTTLSFDDPLTFDTGARNATAVLLSGQGNNLVAYDLASDTRQRVITNATDDPTGGLDINGQHCRFPDGSGRLIAGEDTGQPDPPAGWGIFELLGTGVGDLEATQVGKLTPTYQPGTAPENFGCAFLSDGRLLTTDVGAQASGPGTGQLIVWFPPLETGAAYCKLDVGISTALSVVVDHEDRVYVASARYPGAGIWRYDGPFPTGPTAADGCGRTDVTGAPLADAVTRTLFIGTAEGLAAPAGLAPTPAGGWYASSPLTGVINEYDASGAFVRTVLAAAAGETVGPTSLTNGSPIGLALGPDGTLYYADLGLVIGEDGLGPGRETGTVRRIRFVDGEPQPPEIMDEGLFYPDAVSVIPLG